MAYYVYIMQSRKNDSLYKGSTDNLIRRFSEHNSGESASTARYLPWDLVWYTRKAHRSEGVKLEMKLKNLSTQRIIDLIRKYPVEKEVGLEVTLVRLVQP